MLTCGKCIHRKPDDTCPFFDGPHPKDRPVAEGAQLMTGVVDRNGSYIPGARKLVKYRCERFEKEPSVARCSCGREYSLEEFRALPETGVDRMQGLRFATCAACESPHHRTTITRSDPDLLPPRGVAWTLPLHALQEACLGCIIQERWVDAVHFLAELALRPDNGLVVPSPWATWPNPFGEFRQDVQDAIEKVNRKALLRRQKTSC